MHKVFRAMCMNVGNVPSYVYIGLFMELPQLNIIAE